MNNNLYNLNQSDQDVVSLFDLVIQIFKHWRSIIITTIIFAVLLSGFKYMKDFKTIANTNVQNEVSLEELQKNMTEEEQSNLSQAQIVQRQLEQKKKYQSESVIMNIEPYEKSIMTLQYYVDTNYTYNLTSDNKKDNSSELVNSYITYIQTRGELDAVCNKMGWKIDKAYVSELIEAVAVNYNDNEDNGVFAVNLTGIDKKSAKELADVVVEVMKEYQLVLDKKIESHELKLIKQEESVVVDNTLADRQISLEDSIIALQNKLNTLKQGLTAEQQQILSSDEATAEDDETIVSTKTSLSKKYIIFGAFVGLFLSCAWVTLSYIFNKKVKSSKEVQEKYGVRVFGEISFGKKKRFLSVIDNWVDSIQNKDRCSLEEQRDFIYTNLKTTCNKENIQHLFLTTSLQLSQHEMELINILIQNLKTHGIQVIFGENIIRNNKSFEQMAEIANVVIIEKAEETSYTVLQKELLMCNEQKANLLGLIVIQ